MCRLTSVTGSFSAHLVAAHLYCEGIDAQLRVLRTGEPAVLDAYWDEVGLAAGADARFDESVSALGKELADTDAIETRARRIVERLATVFQASLLLRHAPPALADAFCASRLAGDAGRVFGTLPPGIDARSIVDRARPALADG